MRASIRGLLLQHRGVLLLSLALITLSIAIRVPYATWPISPDEAGYAVGASWWSRGVTLYSDDLWFDRPQGIFLVYRAGMALLGDSVVAIRMWGAIWFGLGAAALLVLTRELCGRRAGFAAGLVTAVASASPFVEGFTANAEAFMVTLTTISAFLVWRRQWAWAGLCAGLAIQLKPSGAAAALLALLWLADNRSPARDWLKFAVPAAVPLLAGALHGWATVGLGTYLDAAILFRIEHPVDQQLLRLRWGFMSSGLLILPLSIGAALGVSRMESRSKRFLLAFLATSVGGVAMGGNWWPHYFSQLVPPLAVPFGAMLADSLSRIRPVALVVAGAASGIVLAGIVNFAVKGPVEGNRLLFNRPGLEIEREFGEYIDAHARPDDRIYVAFTEPGVNYHARRLSAVPWLYAQQIAEIDGAYTRVLDAASGGEPAFVVVMKDRPAFDEYVEDLVAAMGERYELVVGHSAADLYRRR